MTQVEPVRVYKLPAAILSEYGPSAESPLGHIHTRLIDGAEGVNAPLPAEEYGRVCEEMGFPATDEGKMRYAVMHEIGHHLVAYRLNMTDESCHNQWLRQTRDGDGTQGGVFSRIIYNACHGIEQSMEQLESQAEEHLVNRLQRFAMTGDADPYGELERVFGERLPELARELMRISMPWLGEEGQRRG